MCVLHAALREPQNAALVKLMGSKIKTKQKPGLPCFKGMRLQFFHVFQCQQIPVKDRTNTVQIRLFLQLVLQINGLISRRGPVNSSNEDGDEFSPGDKKKDNLREIFPSFKK